MAGSSFGLGGGFLKIGGIYLGLSIEIVTSQDTFITTHIKAITVHKP